MSEQSYSYISHHTGFSANHMVKTNYENFEKGAIVETIGNVMKNGTGHDFEVLEANQLHTTVKSTLHLAGSQMNLTPLKFVASSEMKVSKPVPSPTSISGDRQHLLQVLTPYNSLWDTLDDLKNAVIEHVSKIKDELSKPTKNVNSEFSSEIKCPSSVFPNSMFVPLSTQNTLKNGDAKDWEVRSQYGTLRLSAKSIAKLHSSTELDWTKQIDNVQSCTHALEADGIQIVRHKIIAKNVKGDTYVMDNVYLPCSPNADHSLGIFVVSTGNLKNHGAIFKKVCENIDPKLVAEESLSYQRSYVSIPKNLFSDAHGSFRYDIVRLHTPKMLELLNDISKTHITSQVYKAILKLRPEGSMSESVKKLTAQQKGKWLRSLPLLKTYENLLKSELSKKELKLAKEWMEGAMRVNPNPIKCCDANMFKNAAKGNFEIGSINSEFDIRFNFEGSFDNKKLEVRVRNPWNVSSHGLIIY